MATNLPGDLFTDTTHHNQYVCNAPSGTPAPACTSVSTAGWLQVNSGGLSSYTSGLFSGPDTTRTIVQGTHNLAYPIFIQVLDNNTPRNVITAAPAVNSATGDVTITFATGQSNYYINLFGTPNGGSLPGISWTTNLTNTQWTTSLTNAQWTGSITN